MGISMRWLEEIQMPAGFKFIALPTTFEAFLLATFSDLAKGWTTATFACLFASHLYQSTQDRITLIIVLKFLKKEKIL
jgi:hypothetical protein